MIQFLHKEYLWLTLSFIFLILPWLVYRKNQAAANLFWLSPRKAERAKPSNQRRAILQGLAMALILLSFTLAFMQPVGETIENSRWAQGRKVLILLDVSRSMNAEDIYPSRLERAKWELLETMESMSGDSVSLIAFAGDSVLKTPFTQDLGFLRLVLEEIDHSSVTRGGSNLGGALKHASEIWNQSSTAFTGDILLITDGGDHESNPIEAAKVLGDQGIRLLIIGLGDPSGTELKDDSGSTLYYQGQAVISPLESELLKEIAAQTPGGKYLQVGTSPFQLSQIYDELVSTSQEEGHLMQWTQHRELYVYFLIPALVGFFMLLGIQLFRLPRSGS